MYFLAKMRDKGVSEMLAVAVKTLKGIEVKTMTYDNGTENTKHGEINKILNCKSLFCNAYHSRGNGSIESRSKILRQFFQGGSNFNLISEETD